MRVTASDGSAILKGDIDTHIYRKVWCSSDERARELALRTVGGKRELRLLQERQPSRTPFRFEVIRVTPISFWTWLTSSYRGLLMHDRSGNVGL
jgi:hypothetical protein